MKITKIISGAQAGADRAGIDAAIACGVPYGGKVPAGRRAEDGPIADHYECLEEITEHNYIVRTEANVADADLTIVFTRGTPYSGSRKTIEFAWKHGRPFLHIDLVHTGMNIKSISNIIISWIEATQQDELIINIAGSRESTCKGIAGAVFHSMIEVISHFT